MLSNDLTALTDGGAITGMEAREDGVYITYKPSAGADPVSKKLGSGKKCTNITINTYNGRTHESYDSTYVINYDANGNATSVSISSGSNFTFGNTNPITVGVKSYTIK